MSSRGYAYGQNPSRIVDYWRWLIDAEVLHFIGQDAPRYSERESGSRLVPLTLCKFGHDDRPFVLLGFLHEIPAIASATFHSAGGALALCAKRREANAKFESRRRDIRCTPAR